jgi:hypothetical protein
MVREREDGSLEMMSFSEKCELQRVVSALIGCRWRFVTVLGGIKESVACLRALHREIDPAWGKVMSPTTNYRFGLTGDLKYMLTCEGTAVTLLATSSGACPGHLGASSSKPCPCCVRPRVLLALGSWRPGNQAAIRKGVATGAASKNKFPTRANIADCGSAEVRYYPNDADCAHDVDEGSCYCIAACAVWLEARMKIEFPSEADRAWDVWDVKAPFHARVLELAQVNTHSIIAHPVFPEIVLIQRMPGVWHAIHNTRVVLWLIGKDFSATTKLIPALENALCRLKLPRIKVASTPRPRNTGPGFNPSDHIESVISQEAEEARQAKQKEEEGERIAKRAGCDGTELRMIFHNIDDILEELVSAAVPTQKLRVTRFRDVFSRLCATLVDAERLALADIWPSNKAAEMGAQFRSFHDQLTDNIGPQLGLPYEGSAYSGILPIHWLAEPTHFEATASHLFEAFGVSPGSGTDSIVEKENQSQKQRVSGIARESKTSLRGCKWWKYLVRAAIAIPALSLYR